MSKMHEMRLGELIGKFGTCCAGISITGLCEEYRDGVDSLIKEPWYKEAKGRKVKVINVIGSDSHSFEICIDVYPA